MDRGKLLTKIVLCVIIAVVCGAVASVTFMDGRPVRVSGRYVYSPRDVSAKRFASLAGISAIIGVLTATFFLYDYVKQRRIDRMSKKIMQGLCPYCGYGLGDTTGTATCPECGKRNALPVKPTKPRP